MFHPKETEWSIINNHPFSNCIISKRESLRYFCYEAATAAFVQKVAEAKNDPEGGKIKTMPEYYNRQIPEYYPTMYMDGFKVSLEHDTSSGSLWTVSFSLEDLNDG